MQHGAEGDDGVEGRVRQVEPLGVHSAQLDVRRPLDAAGRCVQHPARQVDSEDRARGRHGLGGGERGKTGPASHVEHPVAGLELGECDDLLGERPREPRDEARVGLGVLVVARRVGFLEGRVGQTAWIIAG